MSRQVVSESDALVLMCVPPLPGSGEIRLTAEGSGWMGTFAKLVEHAVRDVIADGSPFRATVVAMDDDAVYTVTAGVIYGVSECSLHIQTSSPATSTDDLHYIPFSDVLSLTIH
jgi:hypothetical protein